MIKNKLGDFVNIRTGKLDANASSIDGEYPFFTCSKESLKISSFSYDCKCVLVAGNGDLNVKYYEGKFDAYQRTYIIESKDESILDTRYLYWFLFKYVEKLRELSIGGVIKYIKINNLTDPIIPLPPLEDQKRIVKILDKADALRQKRKQAIGLLDDYLKSVFLEMFGDPVKNEKGWEVKKVGDIIERLESGKSLAGQEESEYKVLKTSSVSYCNFNPKEIKSLPKNYQPPQNHFVKKGDVLISRMNTNELVGAAAYVGKEIFKVTFPDRIWRVKWKNIGISPVYFWKYVNRKKFRDNLSKSSGGTSGSMKNISQSKYLNYQFVYPPYELQKKFENIYFETELLKQSMLTQSVELETQFQALMQKAFKGEL